MKKHYESKAAFTACKTPEGPFDTWSVGFVRLVRFWTVGYLGASSQLRQSRATLDEDGVQLPQLSLTLSEI